MVIFFVNLASICRVVYNKLYDIKVKSQNLHFYCAGKKMEYQNSTYGKRNDRA